MRVSNCLVALLSFLGCAANDPHPCADSPIGVVGQAFVTATTPGCSLPTTATTGFAPSLLCDEQRALTRSSSHRTCFRALWQPIDWSREI